MSEMKRYYPDIDGCMFECSTGKYVRYEIAESEISRLREIIEGLPCKWLARQCDLAKDEELCDYCQAKAKAKMKEGAGK